MKFIRYGFLYMALALGANVALADTAALEALREGDMKKLTFHTTPQAAPAIAFEREDGSSGTLADYAGKHVVLNCPCWPSFRPTWAALRSRSSPSPRAATRPPR